MLLIDVIYAMDGHNIFITNKQQINNTPNASAVYNAIDALKRVIYKLGTITKQNKCHYMPIQCWCKWSITNERMVRHVSIFVAFFIETDNIIEISSQQYKSVLHVPSCLVDTTLSFHDYMYLNWWLCTWHISILCIANINKINLNNIYKYIYVNLWFFKCL